MHAEMGAVLSSHTKHRTRNGRPRGNPQPGIVADGMGEALLEAAQG